MFTFSANLRLIISNTMPLFLGLLSLIAVQLADTVFIGKLGLNELTAQGITLPFNAILIGIQVGIGVAATAIISQALGARLKEQGMVTASIAVIFAVLLLSVICLLLWLYADAVFAIFIEKDIGALQRAELLAVFTAYWPAWLFSAVCAACLYLLSCVYRANGDTKTPGVMLISASLINLLLDPLLIFTLKMGIQGAAWASSIAFASCVLYLLYKVRSQGWFGAIEIKRSHLHCFLKLLRLSLSTISNQMLPSLGTFMVMMMIANMGTEAVAFWSLQARMETFLLVVSLSLTMSIPPLIGRYLGEGKVDNIASLLRTTAKFLLLFHFAIACLIFACADLLVPVISSETQLQEWLHFSLLLLPFSYGPLGLCMVIISAFNALGVAKKALLLSFVRLFVLYIPAIYLSAQSAEIAQIVIAATLANLLAGLNAWWMFERHIAINSEQTVRLAAG